MSGKSSIQVAIKVRPLLKKEKEQQSVWRVVENSIQLSESQGDPIYFDHIFDQDACNQVVFDKVAKPIVHSAIEGFNGTIFAYGQTSSGKTYTMMGDEENPGVMVLAAKEIFRQIELTTERQFLLRIGYIEIYNEKIYDLLNKKNQDLKIHETNGLISVNCEESIITCEENFLQHLADGTKERTVGETNMNERSSRSHAIFRVIIESRKMDRSEDDSVIQSVLNLVDLAGSERADQTGATGARLKEGGHINKSLLFLSNVIKRLSEDEDHKYISYRDSKLTRILQASLGGNALTAIICTIKPTVVEETQSTLNFALRAKIIKTKPQVNETVSDATMMKRLEREIQMLRTRLEEEQRKNESQIKVRQLEQRIRTEDLKIISCISLCSGRNREIRRRTWCPSSTNLDSSSSHLPSSLPVPQSRLQPPKSFHYLTPLITMRPPKEPSSAPNSLGGLPVPEEPLPEIDEEFAPADMVDFEMLSPLQTPGLRPKSQYRVSITPKVTQNKKKNLEVVENELMELQEFTNLENKADIQHDTDLALKQIAQLLTNRNAVLEKERLEYLEVKNEMHLTSDRLNEHEKRCDELQIHVTKLTSSNKVANEKISKYEHELAELKKTNEKLEMENRDAVNLEFEFERHKNKSKLRENELLELLNDKQHELNKLEKSLKTISDEQLQNTKEGLLQLSLTESKADPNGKVCVKCEDLQRLLEENRKVTQEFEKLTLEFQQLKLNFKEIEKENETSKAKVVELEELQKSESVECEKLHKELQELKEKLYDIQKEYEQVNLENSSKIEECLALNHQVELARQEMVVLQDKYNVLELSWQKQQQTLKDIEFQYAEIESKYHHLQTEYKQLECCKGESLTDCERLQKENVELQTQIDDLKHKVQDVQHQLLENADKTESYHVATSKANEETSNVQKQNEQLKQQLSELQTQFDDLQKVYDDLSNQFMDNLQDSETLKDENTKLEEKLKVFEDKSAEVSKAETEMCVLKSQIEKLLTSERKLLSKTPPPCCNSSMRSSGVCIEEVEFDDCNESDDLLQKFCQLSECLTQIELEQQDGKRRVFKTPTTAPTPNYKLYLRNISGVSKAQKDFVDEMEKIHLQGSFKQHSFHIVELNQSTEDGVEKSSDEYQCNEIKTNDCQQYLEYIDKLKEQISSLKELHEQERQSNKSLLENTERTLSEMREQITQLSAELLEKSTFVENCACKTYQMQIECLEKEKADMTLVCEELQEKVTNYTLDGSIMNSTVTGDIKVAKRDFGDELDSLRSKENEMQETIESQTKMLEDLTQQNLDLESDLKTAQDALETQEKNYKEKCNQLQLEMLEKLEISANRHRDNMKKYNSEWEEGKVAYESTIKDLENQLKRLGEESEKLSHRDRDNTREIQEQLNMVREEFNQLQAAHLELQQSTEASRETLKEHDAIKQEKDDIEKQLQEKLKELDVVKQEKIGIEGQFEEKAMDLDALRQETATLEEQLLYKTEENDKQIAEIADLYEKMSSLQEQVHQSLQTLDDFKNKEVMSLKENESLKETLITLTNSSASLELEKCNLDKLLQQCNEELQLLRNKHVTFESQLTHLTEENKSLFEQCSQLFEEKRTLEEQLKYLSGKEKIEELLNQMIIEKTELFNTLRLANEKLESKQEELDKITNDCDKSKRDVEMLKCSLLSSSREKQLLEEQLEQYQQLSEEKAKLEVTLSNLKSLQSNTLKSLQHEKDSAQKTLSKYELEISVYKQKEDTLLQKTESLSQQLHEMRLKANEYETLLVVHEELENSLSVASKQNADLSNEITKLKSTISSTSQAQEDVFKSQTAKIQKLDAQLLQSTQQEQELRSKLNELQDQLQRKQSSLQHQSHELKGSLAELQLKYDSLQATNTQLQTQNQILEQQVQRTSEQLQEFKSLQDEEKSKFEVTLSNLKSLQSNALKSLKHEKDSALKTLSKYELEISVYKQKEDTLLQKTESLSQQLHEMRLKANAYETLLVDHEELENSLSAASKQNADLSNEITKLKSTISSTSQAQEDVFKSQTDKIQKLDAQLLQSTQQEQELRSKLNELQEQLQRKQSSLQHQSHELKGSLAELQLKYGSLQATHTQLQTQNQILEQQVQRTSEQLKEFKSLQDELSGLKVKYGEIQRKMEATIDEAGRCTRALREELQHHKKLLEKQLELYNTLRIEMNTKESSLELEKEKLTSTINTLQTEKSSLEEKIREMTVNNFKQDLHRQTTDISANSSVDGSTSSSSPRSRRSIENMNISVEDKLCTNHARGTQHTAERKNRRLSSFNERRQSYWGVTHDKETMTDPVDTSCNCVELDQKLQESEKKLFIRESQVTALNMELRNHPLKDQNAALMKRLEEEQGRYRTEMKRYKQKLHDQTMKFEKALAAATATTELKPSEASSSTSDADAALTPPTVMENAETQTDCDLSASLHKLQGKYNDLVNICRHRKKMITELEERFAQKENPDSNSDALDAGQMVMLKSQCESMKKELKVINEKYSAAKLVLHARREEISRLRSELEQS